MHVAKKKFGQNFLIDHNIIAQIIGAINPQISESILEIGPGKGAITSSLLQAGSKVTAVEIDKDLHDLLAKKFANLPNFKLCKQDILTYDFSQIRKHTKIVGNLPYNISTPILFKCLQALENIDSLIFMLQKEVADRIVALPATKQYGKLSVMLQYFFVATKLFEVPATSFVPQPKVTSSIIKLTPRTEFAEQIIDLDNFRNLVSKAFTMRRKIIIHPFKGLLSKEELTLINIDTKLRAENLSVADFVKLSNFISQKQFKA